MGAPARMAPRYMTYSYSYPVHPPPARLIPSHPQPNRAATIPCYYYSVVADCAQRDTRDLFPPSATGTPQLALGEPSGSSPAHLSASRRSTATGSALDTGNGSWLASIGHDPTLRVPPAHAPVPANLVELSFLQPTVSYVPSPPSPRFPRP